MQINRTHRVARAVGAVALSGLLAGGAPLATIAYAASSQELSSQLSDAKAKLDDLTKPVSYTHLDVYKRQASRRRASSSSASATARCASATPECA